MKEIKLLYGKDFSIRGGVIMITSQQMANVLNCNNEDICKMIDEDIRELGNSWDNPPLDYLGSPMFRKSKQSDKIYEMDGTMGVMMIVCKIKDPVLRLLMIRAVNEAELFIKNNFTNIQNPAQIN